ncbi:hypothetical protein D9758_011050 [Tetrapyrgos nigripes]|uniref:Uncharacterized protein n=1 Tax=Tetrapyrgos nigripes TaxID=182062 RepID=A0A8H5CU83_9AGAR|nr:hypothetical protein D9758_011050 [Tetrapyrgos nigripes]
MTAARHWPTMLHAVTGVQLGHTSLYAEDLDIPFPKLRNMQIVAVPFIDLESGRETRRIPEIDFDNSLLLTRLRCSELQHFTMTDLMVDKQSFLSFFRTVGALSSPNSPATLQSLSLHHCYFGNWDSDANDSLEPPTILNFKDLTLSLNYVQNLSSFTLQFAFVCSVASGCTKLSGRHGSREVLSRQLATSLTSITKI